MLIKLSRLNAMPFLLLKNIQNFFSEMSFTPKFVLLSGVSLLFLLNRLKVYPGRIVVLAIILTTKTQAENIMGT